MKRRFILAASLLAAIAILATAGTVADENSGDAEAAEPGQPCLNRRDIRNFDAMDNEHVYAEAGGGRRYLFTMEKGCFGLRGANAIGISDTTSRICANSQATITYREAARTLRRCRIRNIETVENKDAARALLAARRQASE